MIFIIKLKIIAIGLASIFSTQIENKTINDFKVLEYETEYVYSEKYANEEKTVLVSGEVGYSYITNEEEVIKQPKTEIIRIGTNNNHKYSGTLTGYGPDCRGCSKVGNVACATKNNKTWSLINNGIMYNDDEYGSVHIVAADNKLFPCGTIVEITNKTYDKLLAIVLDTGGTMRSKWRNDGKVYVDLAFERESLTGDITSHETEYYVKRLGW